MTALEGPLGDLAFLLGSYDGAEEVHATVWTSAGTTTSTALGSAAVGGRALVQDYRQTAPDGTDLFDVHAVFLADPETDDLLLYGFDSAGFPPTPSRGRRRGDTVVLERTSPRGDGRVTLLDLGAGRWEQHREFRAPGGRWQPVVSSRFAPRIRPPSV